MNAKKTAGRTSSGRARGDAPALAVPVLIGAGAAPEIWGLPATERLRRAFKRAGHDQFVDTSALPELAGEVIIVRPDVVLDAPVVAALTSSGEFLLLSTNTSHPVPVAARVPVGMALSVLSALEGNGTEDLPPTLAIKTVDDLGAGYWQSLRKRETPYALQLLPENLKATEWRMFMGTYKGATDFVTKWVWPRPAYYATKLCVRRGFSPNMVTSVSLVAVIAAFFWFMIGVWWAGLVAAWLMTFLDTVDGKLARITLTSSKFGNFFDHSIDLVHPPFWYVAWAMGLAATDAAASGFVMNVALTVIIGGYVLQRVMEGVSIYFFKIEIHIWRRIDTFFRQVTARRNPNLVLLTVFTILGQPDWGLWAVAWWTTICLVLHGWQLVQARQVQRRDGSLGSWMAASG